MLKVSELAIGDWVLHDGKYKEVITIWPRSVSLYNSLQTWGSIYADNHAESEIEPIPITPEILEKNGFFIGNYGEYWMGKEKGESVNMDKDNYAILEKGSSAIYLTCKYVHQLQHALRLCGIEKEIAL